MGNTCKPMAVSFQRMIKPTTIKKNNNKKKVKKIKAVRDIADFEAENHTWRRLTWQWCANEFPVEEARSRETLKRTM